MDQRHNYMFHNISSDTAVLIRKRWLLPLFSAQFPLLALFLLVGLLSGSIVGVFSVFPSGVSEALESLIGNGEATGFFDTLLHSYLYLFPVLFLSLTLYGAILIPPLAAVRTFLLGCAVAAAFRAEGYPGLLIAVFMFGIPAIFGIPAFFLCSMDGTFLSSYLFKLFLRRSGVRMPEVSALLRHAAAVVMLTVLESLYTCYLMPKILSSLL